MIKTIFTVSLAIILGCGDRGASNVTTRLGWTLDYADWTQAGITQPDVRGCSNQPSDGGNGTPYPAVTQVHVQLMDASQQTAPIDAMFACDEGIGGQRVPLTNLEAETYVLKVTALASDNSALYAYHDNAFHPNTASVEQDITLRAAVGELRFFPRFGSQGLTCPNDVENISYKIISHSDLIAQGTMAACRDGFANEINIRNIPVEPKPGANGSYIADQFDLLIEAKNSAGNVLYCNQSQRTVKPGNKNLTNDVVLQAGSACGASAPL